MKRYLEIIVILFAIVGGTVGAFQVFATNARVDVVEETVRKNELIRRLHAAEERVWALDEKFGFECERCSSELKKTYLRLKQEIRDIERKLEGKG